MMHQPTISVVMPAFNDEARIAATIARINAYLEENRIPCEIIVVDDGSTDGTVDAVLDLGIPHLRVTLCGSRCGRGFATRQGLLEAHGKYVLVADAAGDTDVAEIKKFLSLMYHGYDIVIASRRGRKKRASSFFLRNMVRVMFRLPYADTMSGFKMLTHDAVNAVLPLCEENDVTFDVEMLYWARRCSLRVREMDVAWDGGMSGRAASMSGPIMMLANLIKLRVHSFNSHKSFRRACMTVTSFSAMRR